ncbi:uncharacterized protein [Porites lutea]|uniref:uncharacterized protein n=1 Tax=Porites lutea TaxID=51062 RepID=UPI003CC654DB
MQSSLFKFFGIRHTEASENSATAENEKKSPWSKFDDLPLEEKRQLYRCGTNFVTLKDIPSWTEYRKDNLYAIYGRKAQSGKTPEKPSFAVNELLNEKVSLWQGDITSLEIDAIVNAANNSLLGGGGVDGCIHRAAGSTLRKECAALNGCSTGDAKITSGHKLPAKYVIHTVGPFGKQEKPLRSCYKRCLGLVKKYGLRTVAFCCVSTGIYGYPIYDASCVALNTVRKWLEDGEKDGQKNAELVDRIIFCVFLGGDLEVYQRLLPRFFPSEDKYDQESEQEQEEDTDETETDSKEDERAENKQREDRKDKDSFKGNGKDDVKKGEEAEGKEVGGEPRAEESSENDRKDKHSLSGNETEGVKKGEEAKEKEGGGEPRAEESSENVRKDKHSLSENEKGEVKKREEAKVKEVGGEPRAEESSENVKKDKPSLSVNEKEEVRKGEEAKVEIGDVEMADVDGVPDPPKLEELLDSRQKDITDEEVVNKNVPSEGQDTTKEQNVGDTSRE